MKDNCTGSILGGPVLQSLVTQCLLHVQLMRFSEQKCLSEFTHLLFRSQGGYNLTSISNSMAAIAGVLLGDPLPPLEGAPRPCQSALVSLQDAIFAHLPHWSGLVPLDLAQMMQRTQQPRPAAAVPPDLPAREEKKDAEEDVAEEKGGSSLSAVAVGPQGIQVPVELTGQNSLIVGELENAGHVCADGWHVPVFCGVVVQ